MRANTREGIFHPWRQSVSDNGENLFLGLNLSRVVPDDAMEQPRPWFFFDGQ